MWYNILNHWKINIKDNEPPFEKDFKKLTDISKEYIKDSIIEIVTCKNLEDYKYIVSCPSIPMGFALLRFPNNCEAIIQIEHDTLYYLRTYENIDDALDN